MRDRCVNICIAQHQCIIIRKKKTGEVLLTVCTLLYSTYIQYIFNGKHELGRYFHQRSRNLCGLITKNSAFPFCPRRQFLLSFLQNHQTGKSELKVGGWGKGFSERLLVEETHPKHSFLCNALCRLWWLILLSSDKPAAADCFQGCRKTYSSEQCLACEIILAIQYKFLFIPSNVSDGCLIWVCVIYCTQTSLSVPWQFMEFSLLLTLFLFFSFRINFLVFPKWETMLREKTNYLNELPR